MKTYINSNDPLQRKVFITSINESGNAVTDTGEIISKLDFNTNYNEYIDPDLFFAPPKSLDVAILSKDPLQDNIIQDNVIEYKEEIEYTPDGNPILPPPLRIDSTVLQNISYTDDDDDIDSINTTGKLVPVNSLNVKKEEHPLKHLGVNNTKKEIQHIKEEEVIDDPIISIFSKVKKNNIEKIFLEIEINTPSHDQIKILNDMFEGISLIEYLAKSAVDKILSNPKELIDRFSSELENIIFNYNSKKSTKLEPVKVVQRKKRGPNKSKKTDIIDDVNSK